MVARSRLCGVAGTVWLGLLVVESLLFDTAAAPEELSEQCKRIVLLCESEQSQIVSGYADDPGHEHDHGHGHEHVDGTDQAGQHATSRAGDPQDHGHPDVHADHADHAEAQIDANGGVWGHKLAGMVCIIASSSAGIALRLGSPTLSSPQLLGYVNVLSGSMFIAMALFHILPEALDHQPEAMATLLTGERSGLAVMICVFVGFTLVLSLERVLFDAHVSPDKEEAAEQVLKSVLNPKVSFIVRARYSDSQTQHSSLVPKHSSSSPGPCNSSPSLRRRPSLLDLATHAVAEASPSGKSPTPALQSDLRCLNLGSTPSPRNLEGAPPAPGRPKPAAAQCWPRILGALCECELSPAPGRPPPRSAAYCTSPRLRSPGASPLGAPASGDSDDDAWSGLGPAQEPSAEAPRAPARAPPCAPAAGLDLSAVALMAVLSVHALFEGIVVGTAGSADTTWVLVLVVVAHKWASAFAVTNQLTGKQEVDRTVAALLGVFTSASPLGVLSGLIVSDLLAGSGAAILKTVLNSMGTGTLLYIGMTEVVPEEFTGTRNALKKLLVFLVAAALNLFLTWLHLVMGHEGHGGAQHGHAHAPAPVEPAAELAAALHGLCEAAARGCGGAGAGAGAGAGG